MDRGKMLMRKYFDQLRFVFVCSLILCLASLFFVHHEFLYNGQNGITFLLVKFSDAKHGLIPKPSGFSGHSSGTIGCPIKPTNHTNQKASNGEGNREKQMGPTLLIEDNIEPVAKHSNINLAPKPFSFSGNSSGTIGSPTKPTSSSNETASKGEENWREQMGPTPLIEDNIEPIAKHPHTNLAPKPSSSSDNSSETIGCPTKPTSPRNEIASNGEGNRREQMGPTPLLENITEPVPKHPNTNSDPCYGKYVYMYDLPRRFNVDLVKNCHSLLKWFDMCPFMANQGLGLKVKEKPIGKVLSKKGWFVTNQFSLDVIFHNSMKNFKCLTKNSSLASAIYVPYYAGFDVGKYLWGYNVSIRDASPKALMKWLTMQPEWNRMWGRDHFMVGGRIGFDYRRRTDDDSDWGTKLMFLPEASNMSMLSIESASYDNDFPVPYPTHFHPSSDNEVVEWQIKMRRVKRPYLFSFAGSPRPNSSNTLRNELITHCKSSKSCNFLGCFDGGNNCEDPVNVMKLFQSSVFCLQPPGDSFTRRSTFDSILAGCIPVFFHPKSAYEQYLWHLPKDGSKYSVLIPEEDVKDNRVLVNETLFRVPESEVLAMRAEVIRLIPRIIYANPSSRLKTIEDAVDIALKGILGE